MSVLHFPSIEGLLGPPMFSDNDLTRRLWDGCSDCPDCDGDLLEPDLHAEGCIRVGTCGQCEPFLDPPLHPDPPGVYCRLPDETWREAVDRMRAYREQHMEEFHSDEKEA